MSNCLGNIKLPSPWTMHRHANKRALETFEEYRYQGACNIVPGTLTHAIASSPNSDSQIIVSTTAGPTGSCSNVSIVDKASNLAAIDSCEIFMDASVETTSVPDCEPSISIDDPSVDAFSRLGPPDYSNIDFSFDTGTSSDENDDYESDDNLRDQLKKWAVDYRISHIALTALLLILQQYHFSLPKSPRTLLGTTTSYEIKNISNGQYFHFGVKNAICLILSKLQHLNNLSTGTLFMKLNIDGLPIFNKSTHQFWPILGIVESLSSRPFVIGLFYGKNKPSSIGDYLNDFIEEMRTIQQEGGLQFQSMKYDIQISCIICDAPARAMVKCIKAHSGYSGCDQCVQSGVWFANRMTFPECNASLRTDDDFRLMTDERHHSNVSPLLDLGLNMVTQFPLDPMHQVYLGVMRRLLHFWVKISPTKLSNSMISQIDFSLFAIKNLIPNEFARKPRTVKEYDQWKATELRQFLLYSGPIVLKGVMDNAFYNHFLLFHLAVFILTSERYCKKYLDYAHELLVTFVEHSSKLYGKEFLVYNVHSLVHLCNNVKLHGSLDKFSAFPFENFLGQLKRMVRKPNDPLSQVIRRLSEFHGDYYIPQQSTTNFKLTKNHFQGPLLSKFQGLEQYTKCVYSNCTISLKDGNNCFKIKGCIVLIRNILFCRKTNVVYLLAEKYAEVTDFYSYPADSHIFDICSVSKLSGRLLKAKANDIDCKCVLLPYKNRLVAFPTNISIIKSFNRLFQSSTQISHFRPNFHQVVAFT